MKSLTLSVQIEGHKTICSSFSVRSYLSTFAKNLHRRLASTSIVTYALFCVFGVGSWVAINGVWAELPVLLVTQPECFKLATALTLIFQIANIGPLTYSAVKLLWHRLRLKDFYLEVGSVFVIIVIGIISSLLLGIFWNRTVEIGGQTSSIVLYVLAFSLALVDCTSSVVFVPFMKHFPAQYLSALYIGEGLSGLLPSSVALIQGSVNNSLACVPGERNDLTTSQLGILFSPHVFFALLAVIMAICGLAFVGILVVPSSRKQLLVKKAEAGTDSEVEMQAADVSLPCLNRESEEETHFVEDEAPLLDDEKREEASKEDLAKEKRDEEPDKRVCKPKTKPSTLHKVACVLWKQRTPLFCLTVLSFLLNGTLPSVSSFAFGSYGNLTLHLAVNLGLLMNPVAAFLFMILPSKSNMLIAISTAICCLLGTYILINSFTFGVLLSGTAGGLVIVSCNSITGACVYKIM